MIDKVAEHIRLGSLLHANCVPRIDKLSYTFLVRWFRHEELWSEAVYLYHLGDRTLLMRRIIL